MSEFKVIQEFKGEIFGMSADCQDAYYATDYFHDVICQHKPELLDILVSKAEFFQDFYACCARAYYKTDCYNPSEFESEIAWTFKQWAESNKPFTDLHMMSDYDCYFEWFNEKIKAGYFLKPQEQEKAV